MEVKYTSPAFDLKRYISDPGLQVLFDQAQRDLSNNFDPFVILVSLRAIREAIEANQIEETLGEGELDALMAEIERMEKLAGNRGIEVILDRAQSLAEDYPDHSLMLLSLDGRLWDCLSAAKRELSRVELDKIKQIRRTAGEAGVKITIERAKKYLEHGNARETIDLLSNHGPLRKYLDAAERSLNRDEEAVIRGLLTEAKALREQEGYTET